MIIWSEGKFVEASQALVPRDILGIEKMALGAIRIIIEMVCRIPYIPQWQFSCDSQQKPLSRLVIIASSPHLPQMRLSCSCW
jgi:hypothetical protein